MSTSSKLLNTYYDSETIILFFGLAFPVSEIVISHKTIHFYGTLYFCFAYNSKKLLVRHKNAVSKSCFWLGGNDQNLNLCKFLTLFQAIRLGVFCFI